MSMAFGPGLSQKAPIVQCEAKIPVHGTTLKRNCHARGTHIYGPECEAETGKLMYVCEAHAQALRGWMDANANNPVECPTHGRLGPVKSYLILRRM